ncbi:hypothetical protein [Myxococcus sp. RHSTA-1-4]|uniref:hypothetical protein n=1 Tax=Myxococcus sp. RHSTA-1-4 TaxID=2874601 RepID=UPI001CBDE776|nr:hypothetical protein [Myxococcus sp. RHSTA-1-4]MBZ4422882.1 hypothetical protein [Myxococcus sp. RHSTA-1-4]
MKTNKRRRTRRALGLLLAGLAVGAGLEVPVVEDLALVIPGFPGKVEAQYGTSRRVARRTSRRTSRRWGAATPGYGYGYGVGVAATVAMPVGASYISTLPAGCVATTVGGIGYQRCGSVMYRPYYQGDTLVYVVESPDEAPE